MPWQLANIGDRAALVVDGRVHDLEKHGGGRFGPDPMAAVAAFGEATRNAGVSEAPPIESLADLIPLGDLPERYVELDPQLVRPAEVDSLIGDAGKAKRELGWEPTTSFEELIRLMTRADLERLARGG